MQARFVILALGLLMATPGCGGSDGSEGSGSSQGSNATGTSAATSKVPAGGSGSDPKGTCSVMTAQEVSDATGAQVTDTLELPTGCQWAISEEAGASYEWQQLPVEGFEANRQLGASSGYTVEDLSGLGDEAFVRTSVGPGGEPLAAEVWVRSGETVYFVRTALLPASEDVVATQKELAGILAGRVG